MFREVYECECGRVRYQERAKKKIPKILDNTEDSGSGEDAELDEEYFT